MNTQQQNVFEKIIDDLHLTQHKAALYVFVERFFGGELSIDDFLDELNVFGDGLQLSDKQIIDVGEALYVQLLSPHRDELEDVFENNKRSFSDVVSDIMKDMSLSFEESRFERRFTHICEVYLQREYDRMRTLRAFVKGIKAGGLALSEEVAAQIIERLDRHMDRVVFDGGKRVAETESQDVSNVEPAFSPDPASNMRFVPERGASEGVEPAFIPDSSSNVQFEAEHQPPAAQLDAQKKEVSPPPPARVTPPARPRQVVPQSASTQKRVSTAPAPRQRDEQMDRRVDVALEARKIVKDIGFSFDDDVLNKRLHDIVIARLKDIRGPYETRDAVLKSVDKGGLGMQVDQAQVFLRKLEDANDVLAAHWRVQAQKKKESYVEERRRELFRRPEPSATVPHHAKSTDIVGIIQKTPTEKRKAVLAEHLRRVKPDMRDVTAPPTLTNPVTELSGYTIVDFHRLHSDSEEAALKIEGKIRLLREESFVKMKQGVEAWKQSEVMRVYREQLQQSLVGGMPLSEVIEKRKQAELSYLTQDEITALTRLNARLKE